MAGAPAEAPLQALPSDGESSMEAESSTESSDMSDGEGAEWRREGDVWTNGRRTSRLEPEYPTQGKAGDAGAAPPEPTAKRGGSGPGNGPGKANAKRRKSGKPKRRR